MLGKSSYLIHLAIYISCYISFLFQIKDYSFMYTSKSMAFSKNYFAQFLPLYNIII